MENNKSISNYNENKLINSHFIKDQDLSFIIRKSEKLATAIYMISNFFNTEEPLKWELRKCATGLLRNVMSFNNLSLSDKENLNSRVLGNFLDLNTLFNLAYHSGFISQMNFEIVSTEIDNLSKNFVAYSERHVSGTKTLFNSDYFEVKKDIFQKDINYKTKTSGGFSKDNTKDSHDIIKDTLNTIKDTIKDNTNIKDSYNTVKDKVVFNGKKSELEAFFKNANSGELSQTISGGALSGRELKILESIRNNGPVTIKDIAKDFPDVSEKTIQRELQKMHDNGHIKKEGERRWTKYYI